MSNEPANYIAWIDCEMTGLNPLVDELVEVAIILTDFSLKPLHTGFKIVIKASDTALAQMNDFVRNMHTESGLLNEIKTGVTLEKAEAEIIDYLAKYGTDPGKKPLVAGNTIGMDRRFMSQYMPNLEEKLHYRSIDVSTIKELSRRWYPDVYYGAPEKNGGHRALADIAESIREMAYLRETVMVNIPGPNKEEIASITEKSVADYQAVIDSAKD